MTAEHVNGKSFHTINVLVGINIIRDPLGGKSLPAKFNDVHLKYDKMPTN